MPVVIEAIDVGETVWNEDTRTPMRSPRRTSYTIPAQVRFRSLSEPSYFGGGLSEDVEGWLTVRPVDLAAVNYTPKNGDRITAIGEDTGLRYFLRNIQNAGHYPIIGKHGLQRLYFEARRPAEAAPAMVRTS